MRRPTLVLLVLLLWPFPAAGFDTAFQTSRGGSPLVSVQVNGQGPFLFLLDTGASGSSIRAPLLEALALPLLEPGTDGWQTLSGTVRADAYAVDSLQLGPLVVRNFRAPLFTRPDMRPLVLHGIAGADLLKSHVIAFDFVSKRLRASPSPFVQGKGWEAVPVRFNALGYAFVEFRIGTVTGAGVLDTGADSTLLNPAFAKALGWNRYDRAYAEPRAVIQGAGGASLPIHARPVRSFALGPRAFGRTQFLFGPLPAFAFLGPETAPIAIIGMDVLRSERIAIDYPAQKVWIRTD